MHGKKTPVPPNAGSGVQSCIGMLNFISWGVRSVCGGASVSYRYISSITSVRCLVLCLQIGASFNKTTVSTFVIDLSRVQPHGGIPHQEGGQQLSR